MEILCGGDEIGSLFGVTLEQNTVILVCLSVLTYPSHAVCNSVENSISDSRWLWLLKCDPSVGNCLFALLRGHVRVCRILWCQLCLWYTRFQSLRVAVVKADVHSQQQTTQTALVCTHTQIQKEKQTLGGSYDTRENLFKLRALLPHVCLLGSQHGTNTSSLYLPNTASTELLLRS